MSKLITLSCSGCLKPLCEVAFISGKQKLCKDADGKNTIAIEYIIAKCPYCGDKSMPLEVESRYLIGPATKLADPEDENSFVELTRVTPPYTILNNKLYVKVEKWEENEKK